MSKSREDYTWYDAQYDMALTTPLTLHATTPIILHMQKHMHIHPMDAAPLMCNLIGHFKVPMTSYDISQFMDALGKLMAVAEVSKIQATNLQAFKDEANDASLQIKRS